MTSRDRISRSEEVAKWNVSACAESELMRKKFLEAIHQSYDPQVIVRENKKAHDRQVFLSEKMSFEQAHVSLMNVIHSIV